MILDVKAVYVDKPYTVTLMKNDPVNAEVEHVKSTLDVFQRSRLNAECMPITGEYIGLAYVSGVSVIWQGRSASCNLLQFSVRSWKYLILKCKGGCYK